MSHTPSLGQVAVRGLAWSGTQTLVAKVCQFLAQVVLTWILVPSDFGSVGLALTVTMLVSAVFGIGVADVLIQRRKSLRHWIGPAFVLTVTSGSVAFASAVLISPLIAFFFGRPELMPLVLVASLPLLVDSLGVVPTVVLRSDLRFRLVATIGMSEMFAAQCMAIGLACMGAGPYSVLVPSSVVGLLRVVVVWSASGTLRHAWRRQGRWRLLVGRSVTVLFARLSAAVVSQADYVILGLLADDISVGLYYFAFKISIQPLFALAGGMVSILAPLLVRLSEEPSRQAEAAFSAATLLTMVVMPVCFLQAALSGPVLALFFSQRWEGAGHLVAILSVGFAFDAIMWSVGGILNARGEFRLALVISLLCLGPFLMIVWICTSRWGADGTAGAVAAYYIVASPTVASFVFARLGISVSRTLSMTTGLAAVAALSVGIPWLLIDVSGCSNAARLFLIPTSSLVLYSVLTSYFFPIPFYDLLARVRAMMLKSHTSLQA